MYSIRRVRKTRGRPAVPVPNGYQICRLQAGQPPIELPRSAKACIEQTRTPVYGLFCSMPVGAVPGAGKISISYAILNTGDACADRGIAEAFERGQREQETFVVLGKLCKVVLVRALEPREGGGMLRRVDFAECVFPRGEGRLRYRRTGKDDQGRELFSISRGHARSAEIAKAIGARGTVLLMGRRNGMLSETFVCLRDVMRWIEEWGDP